jgi:hypothetical protein
MMTTKTTTSPKYPDVRVKITGQDGNVFNLIGLCSRAARKAGVPGDEVEAFQAEVMQAGSYNAALRVMAAWFDVR